MTTRWNQRLTFGFLLAALLCGTFGSPPGQTAALSLNPHEYYEFDYHIAFSHDEVEAGEPFSITVGAEVRCIKDMPFGADEAVVIASVIARSQSSGEESTLLDSYQLIVSDVPDWQGDEYSFEESVELSFPDGTAPGAYDIVAKLTDVSIDGWSITGLIPASSRSIGAGSIACVDPDVEPPPPTPLPGVLSISILGHDFQPDIGADGILAEDVDAELIEGQLSLHIDAGTRCLDSSGAPLTYVSVTEDPTPEPYNDGLVLSAFKLRPRGARFSPPLQLGVAYEAALLHGCDAGDLSLAFYDSDDEEWEMLSSVADAQRMIVTADVRHFSTFALLATIEDHAPASFVVSELTVSPREVQPLGRVDVSVTVNNSGGSEGTYHLVLEVNGETEHSQDVALHPGAGRTLQFMIARSQPGEYEVSVGELSSSFSVLGNPTPAELSTAAASGTDATSSGGMHPVYAVLLGLAAVAFLALVVLLLAKVL
jgi:hypothetical protein